MRGQICWSRAGPPPSLTRPHPHPPSPSTDPYPPPSPPCRIHILNYPIPSPPPPRRIQIQPATPALSRWTLATHQFGRDWEFSWLARNLQPVKLQKIHWVSEPGTASFGEWVSVGWLAGWLAGLVGPGEGGDLLHHPIPLSCSSNSLTPLLPLLLSRIQRVLWAVATWALGCY